MNTNTLAFSPKAVTKYNPNLRRNQGLSIGDVSQIKRRLLIGEKGSSLAHAYSVSVNSISLIRRGISWRDVAPAEEEE